MTTKELIAQLNKLPADAEVLVGWEAGEGGTRTRKGVSVKRNNGHVIVVGTSRVVADRSAPKSTPAPAKTSRTSKRAPAKR